jgi:hypothetical protein
MSIYYRDTHKSIQDKINKERIKYQKELSRVPGYR